MVGKRIPRDAAAGEGQRLPGPKKTCSENGVSTQTRTTCCQIAGNVLLHCKWRIMSSDHLSENYEVT